MAEPSTATEASKASVPPPAHDHGHDDHGHGHHDPIHAANPHLAHHFDTPQQQFDAGKLGIWLFLLTEVLFFAGLFCAYTVYRAMNPEVFVYAHYFLDTKLGAVNTCVLLGSSLTAAWAVRNAQLAEKKLLIINILITIGCAATFMCVKYVEYSHKYHDGLLPGRSFSPTQQVWELKSFRDKHPEAAEYAERLHAKAETAAKAAGGTAAPAGGSDVPAASGSAAPAGGSAAAAASGSAVPAASGSAAPAGGTDAPAASGSAAPAGGSAAPAASGSAAAPAGSGPSAAPAGSGPSAAPAGAAPAAAAPVAATPAAATPAAPAGEVAVAVERPTAAELEPLIAAGLVGPRSLDPNAGISRPRMAHVFFGIYFFMTGLHGFHVLVGIGIWVWMLLKAVKGHFGPTYFGPVDFTALYWHLVDLIWIYLFPLLYLIH